MNLSELPPWALTGIGILLVIGWNLIQKMLSRGVDSYETKMDKFLGNSREHYKADYDRALEIRELEIRVAREQLAETRRERDYWRQKNG
jgi:hypothetical protein